MIKKLLLAATIFSFAFVPARAQSFYADISYQSFRPFINFSIELGNYQNYQRNPYERAYLKGYMDGVNEAYYNGNRFYDLVYNIEAYEAGYRDGLRDQRLYYQLRGRRLAGRYFGYDDYYSPYYSVQLWLNQLSFTFISAPAHRLPRHWSRRVHPRVQKYRYRVHKQKRYHKRFRDQYKRHNKRLKKQARHNQKRYRAKNKTNRKRSRTKLNKSRARQRVQQARSRSRLGNGKSTRVHNRSSRTYKSSKAKNSRRVRSRPNRTAKKKSTRTKRVKRSQPSKQKKVRSRSRSRSSKRKVKRTRSRKSKGGNRSRGGSRKRSRGGN